PRLLVLDLLLGRERVHVDVAVGTVLGALAAADAPVLDDDLARLAPADRADRAADHAVRVEARPARRRHQVVAEAQPLADQARHAVVRVGARLRTLVA